MNSREPTGGSCGCTLFEGNSEPRVDLADPIEHTLALAAAGNPYARYILGSEGQDPKGNISRALTTS
jgi:hypothetical protein